MIDACRDWEADLIVLTGDVVEDDEAIAWIEPLLAPLEARLGKFAILGNHDEDHQPRAIVGELARAGFETLEGHWTTIDVDGATIAIGGTSAPWGPDVDPAAMPAGRLPHPPEPFARPVLPGRAVGHRPDVLAATTTAARSGCPWSAPSSCRASTRDGSTAASSAAAGR